MSKNNGFGSDNHSGVHPDILKAIESVNTGYNIAYGEDDYTNQAEKKFSVPQKPYHPPANSKENAFKPMHHRLLNNTQSTPNQPQITPEKHLIITLKINTFNYVQKTTPKTSSYINLRPNNVT